MDTQDFKKMLDDYLAGKLTGKEKEQAEQWFEDARIHDDESSIPWSKADHEELRALIHAKMKISRQTPVRSIGLNRWLQIAATTLIVALASYYVWNKATTPTEIYAQAADELRKVILTDGSIVWLKANSTLTYPEQFTGATRPVSLQGEALFEVAKDSAHPFVVRFGGLTATVLGTSFSINASQAQPEVTVLTGKVNLSSQHDKKGVDILPREKALYNPSVQTIRKVTVQQPDVEAATARTEYNMHFKATPMPDILKRIEGKFNVSMNTSHASITGCVLTANFTDQSLESTMQKIASLVDFEYTIQENVVTIRGGSCQ